MTFILSVAAVAIAFLIHYGNHMAVQDRIELANTYQYTMSQEAYDEWVKFNELYTD